MMERKYFKIYSKKAGGFIDLLSARSGSPNLSKTCQLTFHERRADIFTERQANDWVESLSRQGFDDVKKIEA